MTVFTQMAEGLSWQKCSQHNEPSEHFVLRKINGF